MAIVKMKRLKLAAVKSQQQELIKRLMLLGCVEISPPEDADYSKEQRQLLSRQSSGQPERRAEFARLTRAVALLDKYAPAKSKLLAPKPEKSLEELMDFSDMSESLKLAESLELAEERIKRMEGEKSRLRGLIEGLEPWLRLSLPLELTETKTCLIRLGTIPAQFKTRELETALAEAGAAAAVYEISADREANYLLLVLLKQDAQLCAEPLRVFGFSASSAGGLSGTVSENIAELKDELRQLESAIEESREQIASAASRRDSLKLAADRMLTLTGKAENEEKLLCTDSAFVFEGWAPAEKQQELEKLFEEYDCAWEMSDPEPEDYPKVPVKLKNNSITSPLNMVTEMYSLPAYDGVDPNPLMMPFFVLFYGIMLADMGYGIIMVIAGLLIGRKKRPDGMMKNFFGLMVMCGISTFIWGAITGGFFGDSLYHIARLINPETTFNGLPALFTPLGDTVYVLIGGMALGFIQILVGMGISFVEKTKSGHLADALMDEGSWWLVFAGIAVGAITGTWWVAIAGAVALVATQGRDKPTLAGKLAGGFGSLYNITGYFGDILSYSRLMALMLAGSVIAQVFNTIGAIPGNIFVFFIIFIIGHALNFGLNLLGCFVHDLRLQCLEYFGKFYKDGGRPFKPLEVNTSYYKIVK